LPDTECGDVGSSAKVKLDTEATAATAKAFKVNFIVRFPQPSADVFSCVFKLNLGFAIAMPTHKKENPN